MDCFLYDRDFRYERVKEVLLTATKNQTKFPSHFVDCVQGGGTKNEVLSDIGHSRSMVLDTKRSQQRLRFYISFILIRYYKMQILLQNATAILLHNVTKVYCNMRQLFYYNSLLQYASSFLPIIKCYIYY